MTSKIRMDLTNLFGYRHWHDSNIYQGRISSNQARWIRVGNAVFVNGRFRTETAISAGAAIATGFPVPTGNTSVPLAGCASSGATIVGFSINAQGSLCSLSALANGTYYAVGGVYFID